VLKFGAEKEMAVLAFFIFLAQWPTHDQPKRKRVQTFTPLFEPFPRMPQRPAQRVGPRLLPARSGIDASILMRSIMNRSTLNLHSTEMLANA
jgi:hypothetical protein